MESHLLQMRGLKQNKTSLIMITWVASFTDAWIETPKQPMNVHDNQKSHLLQMRGLKRFRYRRDEYLPRRIFYRCVD